MKTIGILGLGSMGKIIAKDLAKTYNGKIIYLAREINSVKSLAKKYNAEIRYADVSKPKTLVKAFNGIDVLIHAVHHEFNLDVMEACLKSKTNYIDLGGLYHYTKKQLKLNNQFQKANLTAIIGMGASPGITNVLAKYASKFLDKIENIEIKIGYKDFSTYKQISPLSASYSMQTILEEFSWKPAVFINGKIKFVEPISGREEYNFPEPIGMQKPQYTIHSEIATLPYTLKAKNVSFKIAFDDDFVDKIKMLKENGFISDEKIKINNNEFNIKEVSAEILKKLPKTISEKINQYEIIRVILSNKHKKIIMDVKIKGVGETIDKDTGVPPSIIAQMIVDGKIKDKGVFPPESVILGEYFFKELAKRRIYIYKNNKRIN
ncbi:MAG TPA: saccharopine dehydrogenase C-terminal domain-containing protein [Candidatus Nanoarchaeia archaeon]|nr:saccharopine dehydrogenase C-terminal domain-containing protein [Candidatus Nanoarchaeia archaeon]